MEVPKAQGVLRRPVVCVDVWRTDEALGHSEGGVRLRVGGIYLHNAHTTRAQASW